MQSLIKLFLNIFSRSFLLRISFFVKPILKILMYGNKYTDPIDGKNFRAFLPYGYNKIRNNVLSPSTYSLERHRLLWLYLKNETSFFNRGILFDKPLYSISSPIILIISASITPPSFC